MPKPAIHQQDLDADEAELQTYTRTTAGADRAWNRAAAAHLLRRTGFGADPASIDRAVTQGPEATVDELLRERPDDTGLALVERQAIAAGSLTAMQGWFVHRLLRSPCPALEKLALFWHGHFATSNRKVEQPRLMQAQIRLFRDQGAGPFHELLQAVAIDPAMILWLDGMLNRREHPNENFARELMELFSLGIGHYSETDIQQAARAFTGWTVRSGRARFSSGAHDSGSKTVFGQRGDFQAADIVRLCCEHEACAPFIAAKLARFYLGRQPGTALQARLGQRLREEKLHIGRYLAWLWTRRLFYRPDLRRAQTAAPADFVIGSCRNLDRRPKADDLTRHLARMGQDLLQPPSVKGWEDGQSWLDSNTLLARWVFAAELAHDTEHAPWSDWRVADCVTRIFPEGLPAGIRQPLLAAAGGRRHHLIAGLLQLPEAQYC